MNDKLQKHHHNIMCLLCIPHISENYNIMNGKCEVSFLNLCFFLQCVWLILSRRFASRPEPPTRLAPSQALAVRPALIQSSVSCVGDKLFRSVSCCAVMVNKYSLRERI